MKSIPQNILDRILALDIDKLEKSIARAERGGETTRFSKLVYNHYRQNKNTYEFETAKKLLKENDIKLPEYTKVEADFIEVVTSRLQKLAKNGNAQAIATLKEANIS